MRIWVDLTNSPHVLVMRPVIAELQARGHEVEVTARDFAQTLELCERFGIAHTAIGHHRGGRLTSKARGLAERSLALVRWARGRRFDYAMGHGSNDVMVAGALLRIPPERLYRYGARGKIRAYPGLKEEYYLADFEPDQAILAELRLDPGRPIAVVRTPPEVSLYHRFQNDLFAGVLDRLAGVQTVILPRTPEQRAAVADAGRFIVPAHAIDAQSLVAFADVVVSAGGTMNREAVALGTPVYTVFEGRLGAVDERLIAEGRLRRLTAVDQLEVVKREPDAGAGARLRRDPGVLADLLLGG
jgi:uncharacterized protein